MTKLFGETHRDLQDRFDTRRLANRIDERLVHDYVSDDDRVFIERLDMFFLATTDADGQPTCSYKGGDPGFMRVLDPKTIAFPNYDGNGMYLSMGNAVANPKVGLLFIDFVNRRRMRLQGRARIETLDSIADPWPEAQFVVKVAVDQVFPNCPRYVHQMAKVAASPFVPHVGVVTPVPGWKRSEWACDVLAEGDPANLPEQ